MEAGKPVLRRPMESTGNDLDQYSVGEATRGQKVRQRIGVYTSNSPATSLSLLLGLVTAQLHLDHQWYERGQRRWMSKRVRWWHARWQIARVKLGQQLDHYCSCIHGQFRHYNDIVPV